MVYNIIIEVSLSTLKRDLVFLHNTDLFILGEMGRLQTLSNECRRVGINYNDIHESCASSVPSGIQLLARQMVQR